jgi:hypothetical protein
VPARRWRARCRSACRNSSSSRLDSEAAACSTLPRTSVQHPSLSLLPFHAPPVLAYSARSPLRKCKMQRVVTRMGAWSAGNGRQAGESRRSSVLWRIDVRRAEVQAPQMSSV